MLSSKQVGSTAEALADLMNNNGMSSGKAKMFRFDETLTGLVIVVSGEEECAEILKAVEAVEDSWDDEI